MANIKIDNYLHKFLRAIKALNDTIRFSDDISILGGATRVSDLFPLKREYPNKNFSEYTLGKIYEAYLKPLGYKSWNYFVTNELRIKQITDINAKGWVMLINLRVEQLKVNYLQKNVKENVPEERKLAHTLYEKSFLDEKNGTLQDAIQKMEYAIRLDPTNEDFYLRIAELYHRKGDVFECREHLNKLIKSSEDATYVIIANHNLALAYRTLSFRPLNAVIQNNLRQEAQAILGHVYNNQVGRNFNLQNLELKIKVGINYCNILLDLNMVNGAKEVANFINSKYKNLNINDDELKLRIELILCNVKSFEIEEEAKQLYENLYDTFTANKLIRTNTEFLSEIIRCWADIQDDVYQKIAILQKAFPDMVFGKKSDIEYRNMLELADCYSKIKDYVKASSFYQDVLKWEYLSKELIDAIELRITFYKKKIINNSQN